MDYLKLDKVFTQGLSERGAKRTVAMQIIELAKSLDIEVIAEGAETEEHVNEAAAHGVSKVQVVLRARPGAGQAARGAAREGRARPA